MEIWKDIIGYEGKYKISTYGNVKSLNYNHTGKEKLMKITFDGNYYRVNISKNGKAKLFGIHQLMAINFLGHEPCGHKLVVNHKDFNRQNNKLSNLEIVTQRENANQKHLPSISDYTGVFRSKNGNKWVSIIVIKNKNKYLGTFETEIEASNAYQKALTELLIQNQV